MEHYVGLDVSLKLTAICIVDQTGKVVREGMVSSDPEAIVAFIQAHARHVARVGLETGATATWLWCELTELGLPGICIDARHAKAALKMQINKNDRNDAAGIARIMQCGWYKQVHVKDRSSHAIKALLASRALLVKLRRDLENLGLVTGRAKMNVFSRRAAELLEDRPELAVAIMPLLRAREAVEQQIADLDGECHVKGEYYPILVKEKSRAEGNQRVGLCKRSTRRAAQWLYSVNVTSPFIRSPIE